MPQPTIIPIGQAVSSQLKQKLETNLLRPSNGQRCMPTAMLWGDDVAMRLFEKYCAGPEYYATNDEINLLETWGKQIVSHFEPGSALVDLGCADIRKVKPLLDALEAAQKPATYYALDLSDEALRRNLEKLISCGYQHVKCIGLWGTFDDAKGWAITVSEPLWFVSLGSIFGNDEFEIAVRDLRAWKDIMQPDDRMLLGVDGGPDKDRVWQSLNEPAPGMGSLVANALELSNKILGHEWYDPEDWSITGEAEQLENVVTHQWVARALKNVHCEALGLHIAEGEDIRTVKWFRWGPDGMNKQFDASELEQVDFWQAPTGPVYQYLVKKSAV